MPSRSTAVPLSSLLLAVAAAVGMATIGVISRIAQLGPESITFYRLGLGAGFLLLYLLATRRGQHLRHAPGWGVVITGGLLAAFILFYVHAMNHTRMANAIMVVYLAPVFSAAVAHFVFRERLSRGQLGCIALALLGFAMMQEFRLRLDSTGDATGLGFALLAMLAYSGFILTNRGLPPRHNDRTGAFWQLLFGALAILPFALLAPGGLSAAPWQWPWLLAAGLVPGFLALLFAVLAINRLPTALYGTLAYCEPLAVVLFGWSLFGETLSPLQLSGAALILAGGIVQARLSQRGGSRS